MCLAPSNVSNLCSIDLHLYLLQLCHQVHADTSKEYYYSAERQCRACHKHLLLDAFYQPGDAEYANQDPQLTNTCFPCMVATRPEVRALLASFQA